MNPEELKLKIQALVDNELDEREIPEIMKEIEGSYDMRREYIELLRLRKRLSGPSGEEPPPEWFERTARHASRRLFSWTGNSLFVGSYLLLLGYSIFSLLHGSQTGLLVKLSVAGITIGFVVLLIRAIADRIRESRTDKYKGVMK